MTSAASTHLSSIFPSNRPASSEPAPRRLGRRVTAVLAGFVAVGALSTLTDVVMQHAGVFPRDYAPMAGALYVLATAYRSVFGIFGGYVTARLAPSRPRAHVLVLGALGSLAALGGVLAALGKGPDFGPLWYPVALVLTALPTVLAGERLAARRRA